MITVIDIQKTIGISTVYVPSMFLMNPVIELPTARCPILGCWSWSVVWTLAVLFKDNIFLNWKLIMYKLLKKKYEDKTFTKKQALGILAFVVFVLALPSLIDCATTCWSNPFNLRGNGPGNRLGLKRGYERRPHLA